MNLQELVAKVDPKSRPAKALISEIVRMSETIPPKKLASELGYKIETIERWIKKAKKTTKKEDTVQEHPLVSSMQAEIKSQRKQGVKRIVYTPDFRDNFFKAAEVLSLTTNALSKRIGLRESVAYNWVREIEEMKRKEKKAERTVEKNETISLAAATAKMASEVVPAKVEVLPMPVQDERIALTLPKYFKIVLPSGLTLTAEEYGQIRNS